MSQEITSPQNPRIKNAGRLRSGRTRRKQGKMIIDGVREVSRALEAGIEVAEVFVLRSEETTECSQLIQRAESAGAEVCFLAMDIFTKVAFGDRHDGVVAVANTPNCDVNRIAIAEDALVVVLEGVEKPGNIGAVVRTADAVGAAAVVVADPETDLYNPNAIRASLGAIFAMPMATASSQDTIAWLQQNGFRIYAARVDGAVPYTNVTYQGRCAIALGSESQGLSDRWRGDNMTAVSLPMLGVGDSLNVSVTSAVLCYEAIRQRNAELPSSG